MNATLEQCQLMKRHEMQNLYISYKEFRDDLNTSLHNILLQRLPSKGLLPRKPYKRKRILSPNQKLGIMGSSEQSMADVSVVIRLCYRNAAVPIRTLTDNLCLQEGSDQRCRCLGE